MAMNRFYRVTTTVLDFLKKHRFFLVGAGVLALWIDIQAAFEPMWKNAVLVGFSHVFAMLLVLFTLYMCCLSCLFKTGQASPSAKASPLAPAWHIRASGGGQLQYATPQCMALTSGTLVVGRHEKCDICIFKKFVSRRHFKLVARKRRLFVVDLKSANGTYVNDVRIPPKKRVEVNPGDVIVPAAPHQATGLRVERK